LTFSDTAKQAFSFLLLAAYGIFMCSYFIFDDFSDPYRVFARAVFPLGLFVFAAGLRDLWRHPIFQTIVAYLLYLLLSAFWSDPLDWFHLGQKLVISIYLLSFIAITHYLVQWNRGLFERMLQLGILVAAVAAITSIVVFYRVHDFPSDRLEGIGSQTNINHFVNVYGVFAILAMGFALRTQALAHKILLFGAIGVFLSIAWFGQSRTALASMLFALLAIKALTIKDNRGWYLMILPLLVGALVLLFPGTVEQALLRGLGLRPMIWSQAWDQALTAPVAGHGLITQISISAGRNQFETLHNAYLQVFWQGGIIGLGLFLGLLAVAFRYAWNWGQQQRDFTAFCLLLFACCTMITGVDTLIARPRDQWMLFWFPLSLLLSYLCMVPDPRGEQESADTNRVRP
jgi:O-antigen ligase